MAGQIDKKDTTESRLPAHLFVFGLLIFAFFSGIVARQFETFPIPLLKQARDAFQALQEVSETLPIDEYSFPTGFENSGVVIHDSDAAFDSYTFVTAFNGEKCSNYLLDMEGNILHEWYIPYSHAWPAAPFLLHQATDDWTCWHGAELLPNGDLIANFAGTGFPEGWGTIRLDKDSNIVWKIPRNTHHDVHMSADGRLYLPSTRYHQDEVASLKTVAGPAALATVNWKSPLEEDIVLIASLDGDIIDEFSVLQSLMDSEYRSLLSVNFQKRIRQDHKEDPIHLNNIETVTPQWAEQFGPANPGDILVSLRNISTLALIDRNDYKVKWALTGKFIRQHDPDLLPDGTIMLFDNWGGAPENGNSRIIQIDPQTHEIVWQYQGTRDDPFYSEIRGMIQILPNGNVLVTESLGGRVFEVTHTEHPEIVWEYRNSIFESQNGERVIGMIVNAQKHAPESLTFLQ